MTRDKGGPAFPTHVNPAPGRLMDHLQGMTLEDYYAGEALAGLVRAAATGEVDDYQPQFVAHDAYDYAAAMVAEREKRNAEG